MCALPALQKMIGLTKSQRMHCNIFVIGFLSEVVVVVVVVVVVAVAVR